MIDLEEILKRNIKEEISNQIDEEIKKAIEDFKRKLLDRKDNYIAEIMKGIRIIDEVINGTNDHHYIITFENISRRE